MKLEIAVATETEWLTAVLSDFDTFLRDHASAEKKASGMALNIASHYPDQPAILRAMCDLAVEELTHYREVVKLLISRGIQPGPDRRDSYIRALNQEIRSGSNAFLIDRLLVGAIVEFRGNERFTLVANAIEDPKLRRFYENIAESEARHFELFLKLADLVGGTQNRLDALLEAEARILTNVPLRAALH